MLIVTVETICASSGGTFPDDDGSHQQVKNSLFVGESDNHGMPQPDNRIWGLGGSDLAGRTLPRGMLVNTFSLFVFFFYSP